MQTAEGERDRARIENEETDGGTEETLFRNTNGLAAGRAKSSMKGLSKLSEKGYHVACGFTNVVYCGEGLKLPMNRERQMKTTAMQSNSVRASISFPPDIYEALETLAKQKKVSLAWVVREASERYLAEQKSSARKHKQG